MDFASENFAKSTDLYGFRRVRFRLLVATPTATDLSGNKSVRVVTVYVTDGDTTVGQLVECGKKA